MNGYCIQDRAGDNDPATSDGIFVYEPGFSGISIGDSVEVTGDIDEFFGLTEFTNTTTTNRGSAGPVSPTDFTLPVGTYPDDFERFEGMLIRLPGMHYVTDNYNLGRFGEVWLTNNRPLIIPTDSLDPNDSPPSGTSWRDSTNVQEVRDAIDFVDNQLIVLDDAVSGSNPSPIPFIDPVDSTNRIGSSLNNQVGCMTYSFSRYRILPTDTPNFNFAPRPMAPGQLGNFRAAGFNILNYWTTFGSRGAGDSIEFDRQSHKLVAAIDMIDADVMAIMEFENNGTVAADSLIARLNAVASDNYTPIINTANPNSEPIQVGMIYKASQLTPIGSLIIDTIATWEFVTIAQKFRHIPSNNIIGIVAVHYTFKGGCFGAIGGNQDLNDGQACNNLRRVQQSQRLEVLLSALEDSSNAAGWIVLGDFNAYTQEDPIDMLRDSGFIVLDAADHSYTFEGQYGSLDHAVVSNSSINSMIQQAAVWDINASEPRVIDYNTDGKGQDLYQPNPYRSSDHNPVIVDADITTVGVETVEQGENSLKANPNPTKNGMATVTWKGDTPHLLELVDMNGKIVLQIDGNDIRGNSVKLNDLEDGSYILRATFDDKVETSKLIVASN